MCHMQNKTDEGAVVCQWCSKWEHWECGGLSNNEYDMLSNSSDKIVFFAHNATQRFHLC